MRAREDIRRANWWREYLSSKTETIRLRGADVTLARGRAGLTQQMVAKRLGVCKATMAEIENERLELAQQEYQHIMVLIEELSGRMERS